MNWMCSLFREQRFMLRTLQLLFTARNFSKFKNFSLLKDKSLPATFNETSAVDYLNRFASLRNPEGPIWLPETSRY